MRKIRNFVLKHTMPLFVGTLAVAFLATGCAKSVINKPELDKVKTAAVLIYSVPVDIEVKSDPREQKKKSLLAMVVSAAAKGKGEEAATVAYGTFTDGLTKQKLPFRVLTASEVLNNSEFKAIQAPGYSLQPKEKSGMQQAMAALSMLGGSAGKNLEANAPDGLPQFGLPDNWYDANPLFGSKEEREYLKKAMQALNVDAAIVVADVGYSFSCKFCIGTDALGWNGNGSSGSAFVTTIVNRDLQPILAQREYFQTTPASAVVVANVIPPPLHAGLYKAHGTKMAEVFGDSYREAVLGQVRPPEKDDKPGYKK